MTIKFPEPVKERENLIINCVKDGSAKYSFVKLNVNKSPKIDLLVFSDALKIDDIRINVSAKGQQQIADLLNCILPTPKIYDLIWFNCEHKLNPSPQVISSSVKAMIDHSQRIDKFLAKIGNPDGLYFTVGKTWALENSLLKKKGMACNYGWNFSGNSFQGIKGEVCASLMKDPKTGNYCRVIQGRGFRHDISHLDYSQICYLVSRKCFVNDQECDILAVLQNPDYAKYLNHDGVLKLTRQPGVEELKAIV